MFGTFKVATSHSTFLAADTATGEIVHARPDAIGRARPVIFAHTTRKFPGHAFFLVDDAAFHPIAPRHQRPTSPIIVLRRRELGPPDLFAFSHVHQHTSLLAHPEFTPEGLGMVVLHGQNTGAWEQFRLVEPPCGVPVAIRYQLTLIERVLAAPALAVIGLLRDASASERPVLSGLLASVMSTEAAELLAGSLLGQVPLIWEVATLLPGDPWAERGLPGLHRFIAARAAATNALVAPLRADQWLPAPGERAIANLPRPGFLSRLLSVEHAAPVLPSLPPPLPSGAIGPELDRLAADGSDGGYASLPHLCAVVARRVIPPVKDLCILTTLRDEGPYIVDWLAYHRSVGVDRVFVYTNNNSDGSDGLLRALAAADEISLIENQVGPGGNPQGKAYGHGLSLVAETLDYRWCAVIDADEFIGFEKNLFSSVKDYLLWQELAPVDAIALNWNMVASSGALRWQDMPLPLRFRQRCAGADPHLKTIFRPRKFHHSGTHVPIADGRHVVTCRDAVGALHSLPAPFAATPRESPAWIAHYFYRSAEEFIWKWARGRGDGPVSASQPQNDIPEHFMSAFLTQLRRFPLVSDERMTACAEGLMAQRERLMRLPGVTAARAAIIEHYRARSAALVPALQALRASASPIAAEFYDLLLEQKTT